MHVKLQHVAMWAIEMRSPVYIYKLIGSGAIYTRRLACFVSILRVSEGGKGALISISLRFP